MSRELQPQRRISAEGLVRLRRSLSERDLAVAAAVADCRLLTARHLQRWHFPTGADGHTDGSADRVARRVLARLVRERLLVRLERRIGGRRSGSAGYIYAIGPVGHRLLDLPGPRRRFQEPSTRFLEHTLAVADVVVGTVEADRAGEVEMIEAETEPHCWRPITPGRMLKPDLRLTLGVGQQEWHWFVEVDRGTVHLPTLLKQCAAYAAYLQAGSEQEAAGVFPKVAWLTTPDRVAMLEAAIHAETGLPDELFTVSPFERWRALLHGAGGAE